MTTATVRLAACLRAAQALARKFVLSADVDLGEVARHCPTTLSGADLYALCADAWMEALKRHIGGIEAKAGAGAAPRGAQGPATGGQGAGQLAAATAAGEEGEEADMGSLGQALRKKKAAKKAAAAAAEAAAAPQAEHLPAASNGSHPADVSAPGPPAALNGSRVLPAAAAPAADGAPPASTGAGPGAEQGAPRDEATAVASAGAGAGGVVVAQADFLRALQSLTPSLGPTELAKYEALREHYEGRGPAGGRAAA